MRQAITSHAPITLSNATARRLVLHLQGLTRPPGVRFGPGELLAMIEQLGFVQVDSIQWVERAHHMILAARSQSYRPRDLQRLAETDRSLFEHWTHDASFIPTIFYPYWKHRFERQKAKNRAKFSSWQGPGYLDQCTALLDRISTGGSLRSRDLDRPKDVKLDMWQWHDGKAALEYLWRTGALAIAGRSGFEKIYDLPTRVIPDAIRHQAVTEEAFIDWACRSALDRLGFGTAADIARFWDLVSIVEAKAWINSEMDSTQNLKNARLLPINVTDCNGHVRPGYVGRPDLLDIAASLPACPVRVRALSPFDPVIRDRKRLASLFGFEYRIEIYVPEAKRIWGYYVFPLLEGDRLVGRIDMRARRSNDTLEVKRVWWEPKVKPGAQRWAKLGAELVRQARLAGVANVVWLEGARDQQ
ncbi:MAG: crosslink repair DNA glycosylase YcaQ family protein [Pseudomonadota bacterium]